MCGFYRVREFKISNLYSTFGVSKVKITVKKIIYTLSFLLLSGALAQAEAGPVVSKKAAKVYYSSPIKEFRGVALYQWKKYDAAKPASKSGDAAAKNVVEKSVPVSTSSKVSAKSGN